jgi:hypothetical protein
MFTRHVSGHLAALMDGELTAVETRRANAHLARCQACREARDRFQLTAKMLDGLTLVEAPPSIWESIQRAQPPHPGTQLPWLRGALERWTLRPGLPMAAAIVLVAGSIVFWQARRGPAPWDVVRIDPRAPQARMTIGEWIETDATSRAQIRIGEIGTVDIGPSTRMQLLAARPDEHRLNLSRGSISAQILAPPRLFFVETPASTVVDLGCAYTMTVDEAGAGVLRVTSGWASLEWGGRESLVPAGAGGQTRPEVGPGTPVFEDASERLRQAVLAFDFADGGTTALDIVLGEARGRDTLTLWHLLSRVEASERTRVFDRMVTLGPLPNAVTRDKVLALDRETLRIWREELAWTW